MKPFSQRAALLGLAIIVGLFSVTPHQHDGFGDPFEKQTVEQIGVCATPSALHFHAARLIAHHPCAACTRQHSVGALHAVALPAAAPNATAMVRPAVLTLHGATVALNFSRGPPV